MPGLRPPSPGRTGFATGFAVPVLATGSTATGLAVPVLETGRGGGKTGAGGLDFCGPAGYACREGFGENIP
jgi:hypothetical protein